VVLLVEGLLKFRKEFQESLHLMGGLRFIQSNDGFQVVLVMCKDIWRFPLEWGNGDIYGTNN